MTAGTISDSNILIGVELFGNDAGIDQRLIPKQIKIFANSFRKLPEVIMHEIVHTQQKHGSLSTLLELSLNEGIADFLTELVMGTHPYEKLYKYGYQNEKKLWKRFKKKMNSTDTSEFLYNVSTSNTPDLGYFIGYRIAQAYYNKVLDKTKAIQVMMTTKDLKSIYQLSGYDPQ
jgi:uncharacterized protein YjaZ